MSVSAWLRTGDMRSESSKGDRNRSKAGGNGKAKGYKGGKSNSKHESETSLGKSRRYPKVMDDFPVYDALGLHDLLSRIFLVEGTPISKGI